MRIFATVIASVIMTFTTVASASDHIVVGTMGGENCVDLERAATFALFELSQEGIELKKMTLSEAKRQKEPFIFLVVNATDIKPGDPQVCAYSRSVAWGFPQKSGHVLYSSSLVGPGLATPTSFEFLAGEVTDLLRKIVKEQNVRVY